MIRDAPFLLPWEPTQGTAERENPHMLADLFHKPHGGKALFSPTHPC